jgi:hypothetical protein
VYPPLVVFVVSEFMLIFRLQVSNYNRSFESLNHSSTSVSALKPEHSTQAPPMNDRPPPPQSAMYPQTQVPPPRQILSPISMESRQQPYYAPPSTQGSADGRPPVPSPHPMPGFDATRPSHQPDMYNGQRPPYYPDGPGPAMQHSSPYAQAPQMASWQAGAAPAPH